MNRYLSIIRGHRNEINEVDERRREQPGDNSSTSFISCADTKQVLSTPAGAEQTSEEMPLQDALYGIDGTGWYGPGIDRLPLGFCASCRWMNVPLMVEGTESRCAVCWQADARLQSAGQTYQCETFCERDLSRPSRFEPGGLLACGACEGKIRTIKRRLR